MAAYSMPRAMTVSLLIFSQRDIHILVVFCSNRAVFRNPEATLVRVSARAGQENVTR